MKTNKILFLPVVFFIILSHSLTAQNPGTEKLPPEIIEHFKLSQRNGERKNQPLPELLYHDSYLVNEPTARKIATQFCNSLPGLSKHKSSYAFELVYSSKKKNAPKKVSGHDQEEGIYYYIFSSHQENLFIIVSADRRAIPVLGYSTNASFNPQNIPPNLMQWLKVYEKQIDFVREKNFGSDRKTQNQWLELLEGNTFTTKAMMEPLVRVWWDQSPYYNDMCPYIPSEKEKAVTGCTATAMAQIMKYWNYPERGTGTHSYTPESYPELGTIYANFEENEYNWDAMPDSLNAPNDEVARIMFHCGVSTEMDYRADNSWASLNQYNHPSACLAFMKHFGYKQKCNFVRKRDNTHEEWLIMIISELLENRPVIYSGGGDDFENAGHTFVCDGYDSNFFLHFNFGWGGIADGYYSTNAINFLNFFNYTEEQNGLIKIEPMSNHPEADIRACSKIKITPSNYLSFNETFNLLAEFKNFGAQPIKGHFITTFWNSNYVLVGGVIQPRTYELEPGMSTGEVSFTAKGITNLIPGIYHVLFQMETDDDSTIFVYNSWNDTLICNSNIVIHILDDGEILLADEFEDNNSEYQAYELIPEFADDQASMLISPSIHSLDDVDYFKIPLPPGNTYKIRTLLIDYQANTSYHFDGKYSFKIGQESTEWSLFQDVNIPDFMVSDDDSVVFFKIEPCLAGYRGNYDLKIDIFRMSDNTTEINNNLPERLKLYPNPGNGRFILELGPEDTGENQLVITSLSGKVITSCVLFNPGELSHQIEMDLLPGMYLVHIRNAYRTVAQRIMVID